MTDRDEVIDFAETVSRVGVGSMSIPNKAKTIEWVSAALLSEVERVSKLVKALEWYENHIPYNKVITPEVAAWEKEFGVGKVARQAIKEYKENK